MEKDELFELLDIDTGDDFTYFENLADLLETDREISSDLMYELLEEVDMESFGELTGTYFDQMQEAIPDSETDLYTLIENIKNVLCGMADSCSSEEEGEEYDRTLMELAEELTRFHDWYIAEGTVPTVNTDTGESSKLSVRDALFQSRASKLTDEQYEFDFSGVLDYELSEYVMSFSDLS